MKTNKKDLDRLFSKILNEEINNKVSIMMEKFGDGRDEIDVAKPKGKITGADFAMLRSMKKKETNEDSDVCEQCGGTMTEGECMECGSMYEGETEEGNLFTDKLRKTKKGEKFKIGNKTYTDNSDLDESYNIFEFTEEEMINLIENIVKEEKEKETQEIKVQKVTNKLKDTLSKKYVSGLAKTKKAQDNSKKENDDYISSVTKKMKDYLKQGSKTSYDTEPKQFPKGNGELGEMSKKTYKASDAVEEYIEAFAYPGMTNLVYDEIKPEDDKIEKQIKGHRMNGNAELDEDGNPLGNVVPSEVGERFFKNYKDNLYGAEQKNASYKRVKQPIDRAGDSEGEKNLDKIFAKLESVDEKKSLKLNEEFKKMRDLISYNKKTQ